MEIRSSQSEGTAHLELRGELDIGTAPKLDEAGSNRRPEEDRRTKRTA